MQSLIPPTQLGPIRVTQNRACELLDLSRDKLRKLITQDPTFPRPIKEGSTRQAAVYFDYAALLQWHQSQLEASA